MEKDYFKYYRPSFLIGLIITIFIIVYLAKDHWTLSISILSIVSFFILIITEYLWKYFPFKCLFWIDDFSGKYEGIIKYQYLDSNKKVKKGEKRQVKHIKQTGSKITISTQTYDKNGKLSSPSVNSSMYVERAKDQEAYNIIFNYLNDGNPLKKRVNTHYGTEILRFEKIDGVKSISGRYFTERDPYQSKGVLVDFKWISKK